MGMEFGIYCLIFPKEPDIAQLCLLIKDLRKGVQSDLGAPIPEKTYRS